MPDTVKVTVQPDGLLTLETPSGTTADLSDDELVRLAAKEAKARAAESALRQVSLARTSSPPRKGSTSKCRRCGSTRRESRRPMLGVSGKCRDNYHD